MLHHFIYKKLRNRQHLPIIEIKSEDWLEGTRRVLSKVMEMFNTLFGVVIKSVYTFIKAHEIVL